MSDLASAPARLIGRTRTTYFRVFTRAGLLPQTVFAMELGPLILSFYEEYLDSTYPLPKLDLVAVPDFENGAVGNLGIILFR